jgi:hypothetical protein
LITVKSKYSFSTDFAVCTADVVFVIDNSGSIGDSDPPGGNNWQLILNFIKSVVQMLDIGPEAIRVAAVDFGKFQLTSNKEAVVYRYQS